VRMPLFACAQRRLISSCQLRQSGSMWGGGGREEGELEEQSESQRPEGRKRPAALSGAGSSLNLSPAPVRRKHRPEKSATGGIRAGPGLVEWVGRPFTPIPGFIADTCMGAWQPKMQPKLVHGRDAIVRRF
jgi:hypothetical protein